MLRTGDVKMNTTPALGLQWLNGKGESYQHT